MKGAVVFGLMILTTPAWAEKPIFALSFNGDPPNVHVYGGTDRGWTMTVDVGFAFKALETDDQLTAKIRGTKAKVECKRKTDATFYRGFEDASKDLKINVFQCRIGDKQKKAGKMSLTFDYYSTDAEKTFKKVAALHFEVKKGKRYYYATQDNIVGPVFFNYDPRSMRDRYKKKEPKLWFWTRVMLPYTTGTPKNIKVRCKLDGKKVMYKDVRAYPKASIGDEFSIFEILVWAQHRIGEGSTLNKEHPGNWPFGDNPGDYDCKISIEGKAYRKFKFAVNKEGMIEDDCGPALGMDVAHGIMTNNKAAEDHKHRKAAAAKNLLWSKKKMPKQCKGLL